MYFKSILNQLELAYAPVTAYEFATLKDSPDFEQALESASLYFIVQRPVITFEKVTPDYSKNQLHFEIHQNNNNNILKCRFPILQESFDFSPKDIIDVRFKTIDNLYEQINAPYNNIRSFILIRDETSFWFSPDVLLKSWWYGQIECEIEGNFTSFTEYKVHYVGQSTKQNIVHRLTGHSKFQDILSLESPVTPKQLPANEIVILTFQFQENLQFETFGEETNPDILAAAFNGETYPNLEKVYLDAEKALIKAMSPHYNKNLFKKYPVSKDGLYNDNYDAISYTFMDPITLTYNNGFIRGGLDQYGGDLIKILNNSEFSLTSR